MQTPTPVAKFSLVLLLSFSLLITFAQKKTALVRGYVFDDNQVPIEHASVTILGQYQGTYTNQAGFFSMTVPLQKAVALVFSHQGFFDAQKNLYSNEGQIDSLVIQLKRQVKTMDSIIVTDQRDRKQMGLIALDAKEALYAPSTVGGVEGLIKTLIGSNNELTSQYAVRGGNYDENIVYINDFEIYRPYLVSNGQQEGLSFINPAMVKNIQFFTGGFSAKYGDKMSSVLDIQYKKPTSFSGTFYASALEQGLSISQAIQQKSSIVLGVRNKNNQGLLKNQPTVGSYIPSSSDMQGLIRFQPTEKWAFEFLGILSKSRFSYYPEYVKKTSSVFSPLFTSNIGLDIFFEGQEKDRYSTSLMGATIIQHPSKKITLKWMASSFNDQEQENYDIAGAYLFGDRDFDKSSSSFGEIINPLGAGYYQQYARNALTIRSVTASHRGSWEYKKNLFQWGHSIEKTSIQDRIKQFEFQDSAGYSLPYPSNSLVLYSHSNSQTNLSILKYSGYIQHNFSHSIQNQTIGLQVGVRYHLNDLNKELLISPRAQVSWKPLWKNDVIFKIAAGLYQQPPFYRELKKYNGDMNLSIRSQKSMQFIGGADYQFKGNHEMPFRISAEAYYKQMKDVIPYDIDNVKIRYLGENNAIAYATGIELRLFTELVKDAESWASIGVMQTKENILNDYYFEYKNAQGEIITNQTSNQEVTDSVQQDVGFVRRPTDRRITAGIFLQDYLATNKNIKVHFSLLYGSNMPYNIPNSTKYRNALIIQAYIRADIGFSALLLSEKNIRRSKSPFRKVENIWASLEVFNLINKANTISYQLIKDFSNNIYAIPNRLTPRMLNFKIVTTF